MRGQAPRGRPFHLGARSRARGYPPPSEMNLVGRHNVSRGVVRMSSEFACRVMTALRPGPILSSGISTKPCLRNHGPFQEGERKVVSVTADAPSSSARWTTRPSIVEPIPTRDADGATEMLASRALRPSAAQEQDRLRCRRDRPPTTRRPRVCQRISVRPRTRIRNRRALRSATSPHSPGPAE